MCRDTRKWITSLYFNQINDNNVVMHLSSYVFDYYNMYIYEGRIVIRVQFWILSSFLR